MESGKKKTMILTLGVAGGIVLSLIIIISAIIFLLAGIGNAAKHETEKTLEEQKANEKRIKLGLENFEKTKAKNQMIYRMENSNECRFWRQQLNTNKKAISKISQYCYYDANHKELPHANSDKIWKSGQ